MRNLRNTITDLAITLDSICRKIDRGEPRVVLPYADGLGGIYVGNGFRIIPDSAPPEPPPSAAQDAKYPGVGGSKHLPGTTIPPEDSVAGLHLIAHIPSC